MERCCSLIRLATLGVSGFLGSNVVAWAEALGLKCGHISYPDVPPIKGGNIQEGVRSWQRQHSDQFDQLCRDLAPFDVVVNAAGSATPNGADLAGLMAANAVMPAIVAQASGLAGVRRLVHVSTAAVQGRHEPLDESAQWFPLSPYARSKALLEQYLLSSHDDEMPAEIVIYRPTSVHGGGRPTTRALVRMASMFPFLLLAGKGDQQVPVALVQNVAAGIIFAATEPNIPAIVLQPWEGVTARSLLEFFSDRPIVSVPRCIVGPGLDILGRSLSGFPGATSRIRRLELVLEGQAVKAEHLVAAGFRPPVASDGWESLAAEERAAVCRHRSCARWSGRKGTLSRF